jgi:hypothetical protein
MARQLDFSPLNRTQEILQSQALRSGNISSAISNVFKEGKEYLDQNNKRRQEILNNTNFDEDLTTNTVFNDLFIQKFDEMVRQPLINKMSKKGKFGYVSPNDVNESKLLLNQYERELELGKNILNSWNQAKILAQDPKNIGVYELDEDKWNDFMNIMIGKNNNISNDYINPNIFQESFMNVMDGKKEILPKSKKVFEKSFMDIMDNKNKISPTEIKKQPITNLSEYMRNIYKTAEINESPFLKIKPADINSVTNVILNDALKQMPTDEVILKESYDKKGKTITETNQQEVLGEAKKEMLGDIMLNLIKTGKYGDLRNIAKGAQVSINSNFPESIDPISAMSFSIDKKVNDYFGGLEKAIIKEKKSTFTEPYKKTGKNRGDYTTIEKTNIGWDFGSTPVLLSKDITYTDETGKTKKETFKNASMIAVNEKDKTVNIVIPKGKNEGLIEALKKSREDEGLSPNDTSQDDQLIEALLSTEKYKTVTIPLKDVFNELKSGFDKKKIYLKGFEDIKLDEEKEKLTW